MLIVGGVFMGSAGSGIFGTYREDGEGSFGGGKINEGGCPSNLYSIPLEDVATSEYYLKNKDVPASGESVELLPEVVNKRLVVALESSKEILGNLPVTYNYLNVCMKKGKMYHGTVKASGLSPIPFIVVDLYA